MEHKVQSPVVSEKKRQVFLKVLCILSFAGIGFILISSVISLLSYSNTPATFERFGSEFKNLLSGTDMAKMEYLTKVRTIGDIAAALVCLTGVLLMWNLKKTGYFIYIIGEIAPFIIFTLLFWNSYYYPFSSFVFWSGTIFPLIFSLAFIIMYSANLKRMS